jgi:hypothetical protein
MGNNIFRDDTPHSGRISPTSWRTLNFSVEELVRRVARKKQAASNVCRLGGTSLYGTSAKFYWTAWRCVPEYKGVN